MSGQSYPKVNHGVNMEWIEAKKIVASTKNDFWFGTDYNMNLYRGCHHGCIYCDSRSTCYHLEDFDNVKGKRDALEKLNIELKGKRRIGVIGTGAMSDPYNAFESQYMLTKGALEVISKHEFGVAIATKSALIQRDTGLLSEISAKAPIICKITVTTADDKLSQLIEPNVSSPTERFKAIRALTDAGIYTGVLMMPILPFINDTEENVLAIIEQAVNSGAQFISPAFGLTLREGNRDYFYAALDLKFPGIKAKYIATFGNNYSCGSPNAKALKALFRVQCDKYGILYKMEDIINVYKWKRPQAQFSIFG